MPLNRKDLHRRALDHPAQEARRDRLGMGSDRARNVSLCVCGTSFLPCVTVNSWKSCCDTDIRPTMIGTQAGLGVGASTDILLFVMSVFQASWRRRFRD